MCADAPDTSGMNKAAKESAKLSREAFEWFKQEYERTRPERELATDRAIAISDAQLEGMRQSNADAARQAERMRTIYEPLQDRIAAEAETYDTEARRQEAAAAAMADVDRSFAATQAATQRALGRAGIAPGSAKSMALMSDVALEQAKARAGAATSAQRNVEQQGYARRMDAAGLGQGVFGSQATMQQIASQAGNSAVGNAMQGLQAQMSGAGLMQTGFNQALQGQQIAGNLYSQAAQAKSSGGGFSDLLLGLGGLGQGLGAMGLTLSDKRVKKGTGKVTDGEKELAEILATPVHDGWQYDPAKGGPDDGGVPHTGPMAQDVRRTMGPEVAPGGKFIDMNALGGKLVAGMQALARRVEALEEEVAP